MSDDKAREDRLRKKARRQGVLLRKSRRQNPTIDDHCGYMIVSENNWLLAGERFSLSLDEVEAYLNE